MKKKICPLPAQWNIIYQNLLTFSQSHECDPSEPPKPLILAGWSWSSDLQKLTRWDETINWAKRNGCENIVSNLDESEFHYILK